MTNPLHCPRCQAALPEPALLEPGLGRFVCSGCQMTSEVALFPARNRPAEPPAGIGRSVGAGESACFYHPGRIAAVPCDRCGRFLCPLCDLRFGAQHYCPRCLEQGHHDRSLPLLVHHRVLYDSLALWLALLPMLFFVFPTLFTAPLVLFIVIRYWNAPGSLLPRGRGRMVAAAVLAALQSLFWSALFGWLIYLLLAEAGL